MKMKKKCQSLTVFRCDKEKGYKADFLSEALSSASSRPSADIAGDPKVQRERERVESQEEGGKGRRGEKSGSFLQEDRKVSRRKAHKGRKG